MIMWFLSIIFIMLCVYFYSFAYVEPSFHHWNETNLIMLYDFLKVFLKLVGKYFIENFSFVSIKEIGV
jgi:hypothetical protein